MIVYLGSSQYNFMIDGITYTTNFQSSINNSLKTILLSSDGYILKDKNGITLTVEEGEE